MASNLLRREDGLFDRRQGADLAQLGQLHVLQALGIFGQAHMAHASLDVVDEPALAVDDHDWDALACNVTCIFQHLAARHDVFVHALGLDLALAHLDCANGCQSFFQRFVVGKVDLGVAFFFACDGLEDADGLGLFLDLEVLGHIDHIGSAPVEFVLVNDLWPACWVITPCVFVGLLRHRCDDKAESGIRLVLALGLQVEEHRAVCIEDWLDADALAIVFWVFLVFVDCAQAPGTDTAADCFLKGVVVGFIGHRCLLVRSVQAIADLGQLVILHAIFGDEVHRDAVVSIFVDHSDHGQHDLVDLELGFVLVLIPEWAFPLAACQRIEAPVLEALQAFIAQCALHIIELR